MAELRDLTDDDLRVLARWLHGIRGPGVVDPELPTDPEAEPSESHPAGVRAWAGARLAELAGEQDRRRRDLQLYDREADGHFIERSETTLGDDDDGDSDD